MRTLLLADDNVTVQRVIALTFAKEPVRVVTASDGQQAIDRVMVERPDIVLAGTTLPHINGYELARFVTSKAELRNVPVLLLSGAFETVDEAQLKSSGATGVIEKPVEPIAVVNRVRELLGIRADDPATAGGRPMSPGTDASQPRPIAPSLPTTPRMVTSTRPLPPVDPPPAASDSNAGQSTPEGTDYLSSLDSAFDTLDQRLAGTPATASLGDPSPLVDRARSSVDASGQSNPVYEVDADWFGTSGAAERRTDAPAGVAPVNQPNEPPVYETDEAWFADDQKVRASRELETRELAAEMGIHEIAGVHEVHEVHKVHEVLTVHEVREGAEVHDVQPTVRPASAADPTPSAHTESASEADTAAHPVHRVHPHPEHPAHPVHPVHPVHRDTPEPREIPVPRTLPIDWFASRSTTVARPPERPPVERGVSEQREPAKIELAKVPMIHNAAFGGAAAPPGRVADDFAALLAFEQGEKKAPPMIEPVIHAVAPEITPRMLEQIAATVADRLKDSIRVEPQAPAITGEFVA